LRASAHVRRGRCRASRQLQLTGGRNGWRAALTDLGAALRHVGRRRDARPSLRMALDEARRCGATPLAQRARDELMASGVRERQILRTGAGELTPSERQVAGLASAGKSNREIAQTLVISVRAVETHLRHIYRKLDVVSRDGITQALTTPAPAAPRPRWPTTD
jgi:DNA-binding CsgD family transcriptional regulator